MKEFETIVLNAKPTTNGFRQAEELVKIEFLGIELVRCKDCAYAVDHDEEYVYCSVNDNGFRLDDFCSLGEPIGEVYNG